MVDNEGLGDLVEITLFDEDEVGFCFMLSANVYPIERYLIQFKLHVKSLFLFLGVKCASTGGGHCSRSNLLYQGQICIFNVLSVPISKSNLPLSSKVLHKAVVDVMD